MQPLALTLAKTLQHRAPDAVITWIFLDIQIGCLKIPIDFNTPIHRQQLVILKNLRELVWMSLLPAILVCMLPSCGGGGGSGNTASQGIRPSSLNGVTLDFGGAKITFTSPAPNTSGTSMETGGVFYEKVNNDVVQFTPIDPTVLDGLELSWPFDLSGSSSYEYRPIDGSSGLLTISPGNTEAKTLLNNSSVLTDPADPTSSRLGNDSETIVLTFTSSGSSITGVEVLYTLTRSGIRYTSNAFTVTGTIGALSATPRAIPTGWNGQNNGPGFLAKSSFEGQILNLTEDAGDTEISLSAFNVSSFTTESSSTTERGTVTVSLTTNLLLTPGTVSLFEANYTLVQRYGTEDVELSLVYTGGFSGAPLPANEAITLTFTGGGILNPDIEVRSGTHVRTGGGSGTFIISEP